MQRNKNAINRRDFITSSTKGAIAGTLMVTGFPSIVPASVLGKNAPSNRINVAALGTGRISRSHDMPNVWKYDHARIIAVCDLDSKRVEDAKKLVNDYYTKKSGKTYDGGLAAQVNGIAFNGLVGSEQLSATGTAQFADAHAGTAKPVTGSVTNLANGANGGLVANYTLANPAFGASATAMLPPEGFPLASALA